MSTFNELFAEAAWWLGALAILLGLVLFLSVAAWKLVCAIYDWKKLFRLMFASNEVGGVDRATEILKGVREGDWVKAQRQSDGNERKAA